MINTDAYMFLGLAVVAIILGGYVLSVWARFTSTHKTVGVLQQLKNEQ